MFKDAAEYTTEEMLRMCQDFFGGVYWAWYESSLKTVGEAATNRILEQLADNFSDLEVPASSKRPGSNLAASMCW